MKTVNIWHFDRTTPDGYFTMARDRRVMFYPGNSPEELWDCVCVPQLLLKDSDKGVELTRTDTGDVLRCEIDAIKRSPLMTDQYVPRGVNRTISYTLVNGN